MTNPPSRPPGGINMVYVGPGSGIVNSEMHLEFGAPTPPPPKWRLPTTGREREAIRSSLGQLAERDRVVVHPSAFSEEPAHARDSLE